MGGRATVTGRARAIYVPRGDPRVVRRRRLTRLAVLLGLIVAGGSPVVGVLRASTAHVRITVNGVPVRIQRGASLAQVLDIARRQFRSEGLPWPRSGHLVDVSGRIVGAGRGGDPQVLTAAGPGAPVRRGEAITVRPGANRLEPLRATATLIPYPVVVQGRGPLWRVEHRGVVGVRRTERGTVSGLVRGIRVADASPLVISRGKAQTGTKRVALTFDDGPNTVYTPQILDVLQKHEVRATFFVLGSSAVRARTVLSRIVEEGHELGLHSYSHANMARRSRAAVLADLDRAEAAVAPVIEGKLRWYRPPYGSTSIGLTRILAERGYSVALWSIDPRDWQRPGSQVICDRVLRRLHDGAVILLHDGGGNRAGTVAAVRQLLPAIKSKGYQFVTLSDLAGFTDSVPPATPTGEGALLATDDLGLTVSELPQGIRLVLDDLEVECPTPPVEVRGQIVVPVAPVLERLGAAVNWDAQAKSLSFSSPRGKVVMRALEQQIEVGGRPATVRVPLLLFGDDALVPVWVLCNAFDLLFTHDRAQNALRLRSASRATAHSLTAPWR